MKTLMDDAAINRALTRISHEIIENNKGIEGLVLIGIKTRGVPLAERIASKIHAIEGAKVPMDKLDITFYRDDLDKKSQDPEINNQLTLNVKDKTVILVDDVIYTGRTLRAAIDAVLNAGRADKIQFVALVDRGHRELPLSPNYVGKNVPSSKKEVVHVRLKEIDGMDQVVINDLEGN